MSQPPSRIPEARVADILGEAARLHSDRNQGYTISDLEKICGEANIPPQLVKQAVKNLDKRQSQRRSQRQQWRNAAGQLGLQSLRWGLALILPALALSGVLWFRPQLTSLILTGVNRLQPKEAVSEDSDPVSTQLTTVKEQLNSLQKTLAELKADSALAEQAAEPRVDPLPPLLEAPLPSPVSEVPPPTPQAEPVSQTFNRESFREQVMGKTEAEVAAAVGRPLSTSQYGSSVFWDYDQILDAWTGQEGDATVTFHDGKVYKVDFN